MSALSVSGRSVWTDAADSMRPQAAIRLEIRHYRSYALRTLEPVRSAGSVPRLRNLSQHQRSNIRYEVPLRFVQQANVLRKITSEDSP